MFKRVSFAGSVAAAVMLAFAAVQPGALAVDRVVTGNDQSLSAVVDVNQLMSLTVRKTPPNPNDEVAPGDLPPAPVSGVTFHLHRVNDVDVTSDEGRTAASNMTVAEARERGLDLVETRVTDSSGKVVFSNLRPGLYLLEEVKPDNPNYKHYVSRPKLIVLPLGSADGTSFEHDNLVVVKGVNDEPSTPPSTPPGPPTTPETPPTTPGTPPTTPGKPGEPGTSTPVTTTPVPGVPETPGSPGRPSRGGLASTGADVLWAVGLGVLLVIAGAFLARRQSGESK